MRPAVGAITLGFALLAAGCATTRVVRPPAPPPPDEAILPSSPVLPSGGLDGFALASTALSLQGVPYRSGGADPSGFDCSGLVQFVLSRYGRSWPRVVRQQYEQGRPIRAEDIRPGDLVFFVTEGRHVSHVGIAIGGDRFVHAPNARGVVRVESLGSDYWSRRFVGARRAE